MVTMKYGILARLTGLLIVVVIAFNAGNIATSNAQQVQWAPQARIPDYDDLVGEQPPYLITDQNRTIHAFNSQIVGESKAIVYRQWTLEQGWTTPIDIFYEEKGDIQVLGVFLDHTNIVHIIFVTKGNVFYSRARLANADQAPAWSIPELVGEQASSPLNGAISGDDKGNLVVLYGGGKDGKGTYTVHSANNGGTWSESKAIFFTYNEEVSVMGLQVYMGQTNQLHAVWNVITTVGSGEAAFYTKLDVESREWSDPVTMAVLEEGGLLTLGILTPSVIEYEGRIIVTYYNGNVNGNWWQQSLDGGLTWTEPVRVSPRYVGTNGAISFTIDSNNTLHLFFGQRINDLNHGMWHSVWQGAGWSVPEAVVSGPHVEDKIGGNGFDPRSARAVVSQGNVILVTWATDGIAGENGAWYSYATLDTPELPVIALPTPPVTLTATPAPSPTSDLGTPTATTRQIAVTSNQSQSSSIATNNPAIPLFISATPVLLLILVIIIRQLYQYNRR